MASLENERVAAQLGQGQQAQELRMIEFYSGIGGWHYALKQAQLEVAEQQPGVKATVCAAYDFSTVCNTVYHHNHHLAPSQKPIEGLKASDLDGRAEIWMMSPPCQPHTRQRSSLDDQEIDNKDPRSRSFLHLCRLIREMEKLPLFIVLENVVGFHTSQCCQYFIGALESRGFQVEQFHLSPRDFSCPNERPRYYLIARRKRDLNQTEFASGTSAKRSPLKAETMEVRDSLPTTRKRKLHEGMDAERRGNLVAAHLELPETLSASVDAAGGTADATGAGGGHKAVPLWLEPWQVQASTLEKDAAWCFDIVRASETRTACFTKSYGRYVKGTGSVLFVPKTVAGDGTDGVAGPDAICDPAERKFSDAWRDKIMASGTLRYFTPREVASLMGFPASFEFPGSIKPKKAYEMLGNSLHVTVATEVVAYALRE